MKFSGLSGRTHIGYAHQFVAFLPSVTAKANFFQCKSRLLIFWRGALHFLHIQCSELDERRDESMVAAGQIDKLLDGCDFGHTGLFADPHRAAIEAKKIA
ncbi:hypothetical protein [Burkholderia sp. 3C]